MDISHCSCDGKFMSNDIYINHDIITLANDLMIEILPQDIVDLIFKFIIDYLANCTASYNNKSKLLKNEHSCIYNHMIGFYSMIGTVNIHNLYSCSPNDSIKENNFDTKKIPLDILIESNNVVAHHYALEKYPLKTVDIINIFKRWFTGTMKICKLSIGINRFSRPYISYPHPFPIIYPSQYNLRDIILPCLLRYIYDKYNINILYDVIIELAEEKIDILPIITHFQLPPPIINKIIRLLPDIVEYILEYQKYIDNSIIIINIKKIPLTFIKEHIMNKRIILDDELSNILIQEYPELLSWFINNDYADINTIYNHKQNISTECWKYISKTYIIPDNKINTLYKYLDWKIFADHNLNYRSLDVDRIEKKMENYNLKCILNDDYLDDDEDLKEWSINCNNGFNPPIPF